MNNDLRTWSVWIAFSSINQSIDQSTNQSINTSINKSPNNALLPYIIDQTWPEVSQKSHAFLNPIRVSTSVHIKEVLAWAKS